MKGSTGICYTNEIYLLSNSNSRRLNLSHDPLLRIYIMFWTRKRVHFFLPILLNFIGIYEKTEGVPH